MSLNALVWRGLQALAAIVAALASMGCFFFAFMFALGHQVAKAEGRTEAFQGVGEIFFGLLFAVLSSWLAWRLLAPRARAIFGALLILAAIASRFLARGLNDPRASDVDFFILLGGVYAFLALIMFVLVDLGHRVLRAAAEARSDGDRRG